MLKISTTCVKIFIVRAILQKNMDLHKRFMVTSMQVYIMVNLH